MVKPRRYKLIIISLVAAFSLLSDQESFAQASYVFRDTDKVALLGEYTQVLRDNTNELTIQNILNKNYPFVQSASVVPNMGITNATFWVRFNIKNQSDENNLFIEIDYPTIDSLKLYSINKDGNIYVQKDGEYISFKYKHFKHPDYLFSVNIPQNTNKYFYLKVKTSEQLQLPLYIGTATGIYHFLATKNLQFGIYMGIIVVMLLFNLFIFFSVKDASYLIYVSYIIFVGLTQVTLKGYGYMYLWPGSPWVASNSIFIIPIFNGLTAAAFVIKFLNTKMNFPFGHKGLNIIIGIYLAALVLTLLRLFTLAQIVIQFVASLGAIFAIFVAFVINKRGYRPARFFLIAWTLFLFSVVIFVLRNFDILPFNFFTENVLEIGSAIEVTLLSFALADRINIYKKEKEQSQAETLRIAQEREKDAKEQNKMLDLRVKERTQELQTSNVNLQIAMDNLKETQSQLVEAEKMVSLGQLTAGIAHEINNPINFVKSNIKPLKLDFSDIKELMNKYDKIHLNNGASVQEQLAEIASFKNEIDINYISEEIDTLLNGIEDGASRTAEIVKGLRTFSRLDESELKEADIHAGINATLLLLRNTIPSNLSINRNYGDLPLVECYPGKINQVFMNILNNAIQAIKKKPESGEENITITTSTEDDIAKISISDSGPGMTQEVKEKIFEPFFTTKDVGEGTGLGLSIVFSIIEKHKGEIMVNSTVGRGTEFIITLPIVSK